MPLLRPILHCCRLLHKRVDAPGSGPWRAARRLRSLSILSTLSLVVTVAVRRRASRRRGCWRETPLRYFRETPPSSSVLHLRLFPGHPPFVSSLSLLLSLCPKRRLLPLSSSFFSLSSVVIFSLLCTSVFAVSGQLPSAGRTQLGASWWLLAA